MASPETFREGAPAVEKAKSIDTYILIATAKLFKNGSSQAVRLPRAFRLPGKEVSIHRDGERIILEPLGLSEWPKNFFKSIRIDDTSFERPDQGEMPAPVEFGS